MDLDFERWKTIYVKGKGYTENFSTVCLILL